MVYCRCILLTLIFWLDVTPLRFIHAADAVNQSDTAMACYSCTGIPPKYVKFNDASLMQYLKLKKLKIPVPTAACRENDIRDPKRMKEVPKFTCESGVCVKLKGMFQGETFIVRDCWDRLWDRPVDIDDEFDCATLDLMEDTMTDFCACSDDMCNSAFTDSFQMRHVLLAFGFLAVSHWIAF